MQLYIKHVFMHVGYVLFSLQLAWCSDLQSTSLCGFVTDSKTLIGDMRWSVRSTDPSLIFTKGNRLYFNHELLEKPTTRIIFLKYILHFHLVFSKTLTNILELLLQCFCVCVCLFSFYKENDTKPCVERSV